MQIPQGQIAQATQDAAFSNALSLLTAEVWAIAGLLLLGMGVGMATVGLVRMFLSDVSGDTPTVWAERRLLLTRIGAIASGLWTVGIEWIYLSELLGTSWGLAALVAAGAGIVAAAGNRPMFKPVKALWGWALGLLRKRIESSTGAPASDLDDTDFKRKP